jgi:hypothetical protein
MQCEALAGAEASMLAQTTVQIRDQGWAVVPDIIPAGEVAAVRDSTLATLGQRDAQNAGREQRAANITLHGVPGGPMTY